jgi:hypothetical protein
MNLGVRFGIQSGENLGTLNMDSSQKVHVQQKQRRTHLKAGAQKKIVLGPARNKLITFELNS